MDPDPQHLEGVVLCTLVCRIQGVGEVVGFWACHKVPLLVNFIDVDILHCLLRDFVRGRPSLGAKLGLADDFLPRRCFLPNFFPMTPPGNGTAGRVYRDFLETGFEVGENSPSAKIPCRRNFDKNKNYFLGHDYFPLLKLKK